MVLDCNWVHVAAMLMSEQHPAANLHVCGIVRGGFSTCIVSTGYGLLAW